MKNFFQQIRRKLSKPLLFGLYGAMGCFLAAFIFGEMLLYLTQRPPTIQQSSQAIVLLIDTSRSMNGGKLQEVKAAATSFVQRQDLSSDRFAVLGFGDAVQVGTSLTSDLSTLEQAIESLSDGGGTEMDLGLQAAIQELQSISPQPGITLNPSILLFTDGAPNNKWSTLGAGRAARKENMNLVAVGTGDADVGFLASLTGDRNLVFFANSGDFDRAFQAAEEVIRSKQLVESGASGDYNLSYSMLRIGGWTALLSLGTSLALIVGQNHYLRRRLLSPKEGAIGVVGGLSAGLLAGAIGQFIFTPVASISLLELIARILGWTILGTLLGGGMSFFIPNLERRRASIAGAIGGSMGAFGFLFAADIVGDLGGRLVGAIVLGFSIGLAIAWIEQIATQARLVVRWNASEQTQIPLGSEPVLLGSSDNAHIYLRKDQGFPSITAQIFQEGETIIMQFDEKMRTLKNMKNLRHELTHGNRRKLGDVVLEVQISHRTSNELRGNA